MMNNLSLFLPKGLLNHFDLLDIEELGDVSTKKLFYQLKLKEKNILPEGYNSELYESKGFYSPKTIQDFPIRGKAVYLLIERRRWRNKEDRKEIKSDYTFISKGAKLTEELSDFLKGTGRDPRRYVE